MDTARYNQPLATISPLALTFLSLERTSKAVRNPLPVRSNRDRYDLYKEQLRREGLLTDQRPPQYEEYTVRFPAQDQVPV